MTHKKQGLALTLTREALEALFPVGTQAYTELRQSVLQNFVDSHIKPRIDSDVNKFTHQVVLNTKKELLEKLQTTAKEIRISVATAVEFKQTISAIVDREIQTLIPTIVEDVITARLAKLTDDVERQVKTYTDKVEEKVSLKLSQAISNNVIDLLRTTLNKEMEKQHENTNQN